MNLTGVIVFFLQPQANDTLILTFTLFYMPGEFASKGPSTTIQTFQAENERQSSILASSSQRYEYRLHQRRQIYVTHDLQYR